MKPARATILAKLLKEMRKNDGDYYPEEAWLEIHQSFALPYVELVIPHKTGNSWQIFLVQRPSTDPYWPSMWHLPGGIWRYNQTEVGACQAVARRELGIGITAIREVMTHKWKTHPYGRPISHVCVCQPKNGPANAADRGYFTRLPEAFIAEQVRFVRESVKYLKGLRTRTR
jgi:ADP-ribose pyrophosphatase YjhB (NUDIX family)